MTTSRSAALEQEQAAWSPGRAVVPVMQVIVALLWSHKQVLLTKSGELIDEAGRIFTTSGRERQRIADKFEGGARYAIREDGTCEGWSDVTGCPGHPL